MCILALGVMQKLPCVVKATRGERASFRQASTKRTYNTDPGKAAATPSAFSLSGNQKAGNTIAAVGPVLLTRKVRPPYGVKDVIGLRPSSNTAALAVQTKLTSG